MKTRSKTKSARSKATQQPKCSGGKCHFTEIAPELRNTIYDLVYEPTTETDILIARPPSRALLLSCRQVYDEAKGVYRAAYRAFWKEAKFTLTLTRQNMQEPQFGILLQQLRALAQEDLEHITSFRLINAAFTNPFHYDLRDHVWWEDHDDASYATMILHRKDALEVERACHAPTIPIPGTDLEQTDEIDTPELRDRVKAIKTASSVTVPKKDEIVAFVTTALDSPDFFVDSEGFDSEGAEGDE